MSRVNVRPRGKVYEYRFATASINGVRKWIQKSGFKTSNEAYNAGVEALAEYNNAGAPTKPCNMSYADYLDYWVDNYCRKNLVYNTISTYETLIRLYIKPRIGMYRVADINNSTIYKFITNLVNEYDFSRAYYQNILKVIKGSFRYAVNLGFLKYNPALEISLPKREYKDQRLKHVYSQEDIDSILERFKNNREFTCAFLTACYTGMRTGEVLALTWDDINFDEGFISVKHSVFDKPKDSLGRWHMGLTKTRTGRRNIPLCDTLKEALLNYKKYQDYTKQVYADNYKKYSLRDIKNINNVMTGRIVERRYGESDLDFVFTREDGTYSGTDILKDPCRIIKKELNIDCRFYDLRGSFATHALHNGVNLKNIATLLGHTNIDTTGKYYLSSKDDAVVQAVNGINDLLSSNVVSNIIKYEV